MGLQSHRKISTGCVILVLMCTFGLKAVIATTDMKTSAESVEDVDGDMIKLDLDKSETKDAQKVEIIKQIQKVNNDGSYTVGYEAEDGTFKIESRDVLGNVKGTFGYVDANGEIKRVSYTANNGTGLKNNSPTSTEDVVSIPRYNRSLSGPTTRRPAYSSTSTSSPTRATVIQTIPRRLRILQPASSTERSSGYRDFSSTTIKPPKNDPTTTIVYATSVPTPKSYVNIRPTPLPGSNLRPAEQIARPEKLEINHVSKVQLSTNRDTSTTKPVVEEIDEKDDDRKSVRGNNLRRQLMQETENKYDARQSLLYTQSAGDDAAHVYGPTAGTARPLFTTSTTPRIPALVLAARQRAAQIQSTISSSQPTATDKYYSVKNYKKDDESENDATTESTSEHTYLTQNPIPVQIPANRYVQNSGEEEKRVPRKQEPPSDSRYRSAPQFVRVQPQTSNSPRLVRIPLPQVRPENDDTQEQYLRETTDPSKNEQIAEQEPIPVRAPGYYRTPPPPQYYVYPQQEQNNGYLPRPYPAPYSVPHSQLRGAPTLAPQFYSEYQDRPLTTRDFERLLQMLIYRYQRLHRVPYQNPGGPYIGYTPYNPYDGGYSQYTRVPVYNPYNGRPPYPGPVSPYQEVENMYQAQNPVPSTETPMSYELQRLIPRKKQYNPRYFGAQTTAFNMDDYSATPVPNPGHSSPNFLPPDVREELLYRMLMLALQTDTQSAMASSPTVATASPDSEVSTTTKTPIVYKKPIRSVQILGEEQ